MAAPLVAGAAALLFSAQPQWSAEQVEKALKTTGAAVKNFTGNTAIKRLDVLKALKATPVDAPPALSRIKASPSSRFVEVVAESNEPVAASCTISLKPDLSAPLTVGALGSKLLFYANNLTPNTRYHYRITARDAGGKVTNSPVASFTTSGPVFGTFVAEPGTYSVKLSWTTTPATQGVIKIGRSATALSDLPASRTELLQSHLHYLTDLQPDSTYFYEIGGTAEDGGTLPKRTGTFRTKRFAFLKTGVFSSVTDANVFCTTTFPSQVQVRYGTDKANLTQITPRTDRWATGHQIRVPDLVPGTTYHYVIEAFDMQEQKYPTGIISDMTPALRVLETTISNLTSSSARMTFQANHAVSARIYTKVTDDPNEIPVAEELWTSNHRHVHDYTWLPPATKISAYIAIYLYEGDKFVSKVLSPAFVFETKPRGPMDPPPDEPPQWAPPLAFEINPTKPPKR